MNEKGRERWEREREGEREKERERRSTRGDSLGEAGGVVHVKRESSISEICIFPVCEVLSAKKLSHVFLLT